MRRWLGCWVLLLLPATVEAVDVHFEGRTRLGGSLIFDAPEGFDQTDREAELRLGLVGTFLERKDWVLDFEMVGDLRHDGGAIEQAGRAESLNTDFFRAWMRYDRENFKLRAGRQQVLFGAGTLFRPLGFFDTRIISGIIPLTRGVDGLRATWFPDSDTLVEGWLIPARFEERLIVGLRGEWQWGPLELGAAAQYKPFADLDFLPNFNLELAQFGYHLKGEKTVGFWNETRLDVEQNRPGAPLRLQTVLGMDYTFDVGEGLHVLVEYFLNAESRDFTRTDVIQGDRVLHQLGLMMDQPVGINTVWRNFVFFDMVDHSFQIVPQVEYALTDQTFLYLQLQLGGRIAGDSRTGRLFRRSPVPNGTESRIGLTLVTFY